MVVEVSEGKENVVAIEKANQYYKKLSINTRKFSFILCGSCCYSSFYGVNLEIYLFKLKMYIFFGAEVLLLRIYSVILTIQEHNEFYRKIFNAVILLKKKKRNRLNMNLSVQLLSYVWLFATHELQHTRHPCPSATPRAYPNSYPLSQWYHLTISSSVIPFSSCLQYFPITESFQMSPFFTSGSQNIGVSASTSVLPINTQDWFSLG